MNEHNATEQAYKHGYEKGRAEAIDLINRQKAEIERLQGYNENLLTANVALSNEILEIKAKAVKGLAEKIKKHCTSIELNEYIDNLVQEMVGDEDETL